MDLKIEEFYHRYGPMVFRRCFRILKNKDMAADAQQEVFTKLHKNRRKINVTHPSSYLFTMATHICLNMLRSENRNQVSEADDLLLQISGLDNLESKYEARNLLTRLFSKFPDSARVIAVLYFLDKLSLEEVAMEMNLTVAKVRYQLDKVRQKIQIINKESL